MEVTNDVLKELVLIKEKMAVIEVENRYVQSLDARDWRTSASIFHPEGKLHLADRTLIGREKIEEFFKSIAEGNFIFSRHFITNPLAVVEEDKATFTSYYNTTKIYETHTWVIFGFYSDRLVKDAGEWKVVEKRLTKGWEDFLMPVKAFRAPK